MNIVDSYPSVRKLVEGFGSRVNAQTVLMVPDRFVHYYIRICTMYNNSTSREEIT